MNEKTILIDILDRMCGLRLPVKCCHSGTHYIGRVFQKCYIGGKTTNIGFEKRVPIPSETIGMYLRGAILAGKPPV